MANHVWQDLESHHDQHADDLMTDLFASNPDRAKHYRIQLGPMLLDYSKNRINNETLDLLGRLACESSLKTSREAMFAGDLINNSEHRPALHTLLRTDSEHIPPQLSNEAVEIDSVRRQIRRIAKQINEQSWLGAAGQPITDIVHVGIGGSHLGPRMIDEALSFKRKSPVHIHYVANVDGHHLDDVLGTLNPATTLVIVVSKSFSTMETKLNAEFE